MKTLKERYEGVCNAYVKAFVKKHGYEFTDWIPTERVGEIACFVEQYFFSLSDIIYDIDNKLPNGLIFEWQEYLVDYHFSHLGTDDEYKQINLDAYSKGLRI